MTAGSAGPVTGPAPGERRAWGWVAHLRDGGTTPWRRWAQTADRGGRALPGAQQLELLRRLNETGRPDAVLVERTLTASAAGRGRPDLELVGVAPEPRRFGPAPIDPADLRAEELLRVAATLLGEDVVAAGERAPEPRRAPRPWPARRRYRLVGDGWVADPLRAALTARRRPPGGPGARVLVVGTDVATMLTHAWAARSFTEGAPSWDDWLAGAAARPGLPPRVDVLGVAHRWTERLGRDRVRVVVDAQPADRVGELLGLRRPLPPVAAVPADGTDLARRVARVLGLLVPPARRTELLRGVLLPRVLDLGGAPLAVPPRHRDWARDRAAQVRDALLTGGYPVVGAPDALLPGTTDRAAVPRPDDARVLDLALRLLLEGVGTEGPTRPEHRGGGER